MSKYATDLGENIPWVIASTFCGFSVDDKTFVPPTMTQAVRLTTLM